jgi:hypothetical protein
MPLSRDPRRPQNARLPAHQADDDDSWMEFRRRQIVRLGQLLRRAASPAERDLLLFQRVCGYCLNPRVRVALDLSNYLHPASGPGGFGAPGPGLWAVSSGPGRLLVQAFDVSSFRVEPWGVQGSGFRVLGSGSGVSLLGIRLS